MKLIPCILGAFVLINTVYAADLSDLQIRQMASASKALQIYRESGIKGMAYAVDGCYAKIDRNDVDSMHFCTDLHIASALIDKGAADAAGQPRSPLFQDAQSEIMRRALWMDHKETLEQARTYLIENAPIIQRYLTIAINTSKPSSQAEQQPIDNNSAAEQAFISFWKSTDCDELYSLTEWQQWLNHFNTNDQTLCNTFVQMHQHTKDVRIEKSKRISNSEVIVKGAILLSDGSEMSEEATMQNKDNKWVMTVK